MQKLENIDEFKKQKIEEIRDLVYKFDLAFKELIEEMSLSDITESDPLDMDETKEVAELVEDILNEYEGNLTNEEIALQKQKWTKRIGAF